MLRFWSPTLRSQWKAILFVALTNLKKSYVLLTRIFNPKGIVASSPGLSRKAGSYPGFRVRETSSTPMGLCRCLPPSNPARNAHPLTLHLSLTKRALRHKLVTR
jgi:hypothetical protein